MKRTTLMLDERLLEEAVQLSGERTYSRTVERALEDLVRRARAGRIPEFAGSGLWEGDLAAVRGDVVAEPRVHVDRDFGLLAQVAPLEQRALRARTSRR